MFWLAVGAIIVALVGGFLAISAMAMMIGLALIAALFLLVYGFLAAVIYNIMQYWLPNNDSVLLYSLAIALPATVYTSYLYHKLSNQPPKL